MEYHPNSLLHPGIAWRVLRPTSLETGTTSRLPSKEVLKETPQRKEIATD
jgi:hypothetical protein